MVEDAKRVEVLTVQGVPNMLAYMRYFGLGACNYLDGEVGVMSPGVCPARQADGRWPNGLPWGCCGRFLGAHRRFAASYPPLTGSRSPYRHSMLKRPRHNMIRMENGKLRRRILTHKKSKRRASSRRDCPPTADPPWNRLTSIQAYY